jgi:hypothetical protein
MPISLNDFHSHQEGLLVYLYGATSPIRIACQGPEIMGASCGLVPFGSGVRNLFFVVVL